MNDDPRDELDRALSRGLSDLASGGDHANDVLADMRPQLRRARTRHRATRIGGAAALVLLVGAGIAVAIPRGTTRKLNVSSHTTTIAPATTTLAPRHRRNAPTTTTTQPVTTQTIAPSPPPASPTTTPNVTVPSPPITAKRRAHGPEQETTTTTTTVPAPSTKTYRVEGGQVTVRFANGNLTLVSYQASPSWTATIDKNESTDIRVIFDYGSSESFIRVSLENGVPVETQDE
jgi:hypothetical protein